jgi:SAM-dependent methyltransferase
MARLPRWLKWPLVRLWNAGHRLAWRSGEYAGALCHGRMETCDVCGRFGPMLYQRRVIPPKLEELWGLTPRLAEALARKETCACAWCGATLRVRRLARVLVDIVPATDNGDRVRSLADWVGRDHPRSLRIAEINRIVGMHEQLARLPAVASSDFQPGTAPGATIGADRSEDLTQLSYADGSFDIVLTSETLEHVPDLDAALSEIRRVLVPGGLHLFTIPVLPGVPRTFARSIVLPDRSVKHVAQPICHPGGDQGYPVFTEFGADVAERLHDAGFDVEVRFGPVRDDDLAQVYVARRR